MKTLRVKKQFKKDLRNALEDPNKNTERLQVAIDILLEMGTLPDEYYPHPLIGNWKPHWECHIQPNFLLIWTYTEDEIILARCGTHAELFS
jgi:mRNA interferase YafQ